MFRIPVGAVSTLLFGILIFGASTATAGEPQEIIKKRNSETGGAYFNLNTQVKASVIFLGGEILSDEASMFTDECSDLTIHYLTYKKSTDSGQPVMESCAGGVKVPPDERSGNVTWSNENEYVHVFSEVRSRPDKEEDDRGSRFKLWYQYSVSDACNDSDPPVPDFPVAPDFLVGIEPPNPSLSGLKSMVVGNVQGFSTEEFIRYETGTSKEKENVQPPDITRLFKWLGWFCQANISDTNSDGNADAYGFIFVKTY